MVTFSQIVRVQSPQHGTKRIQAKATERLTTFFEKVNPPVDSFAGYSQTETSNLVRKSKKQFLWLYWFVILLPS